MSRPRELDSYRWLLWLYPRDFRVDFGGEIALLATEIVRDRGGRGRLILALDLLVAVPRTRWEQIMRRQPTPPQLVITLVALATSVIVLTVVLGLGPVGAVTAGILTALTIALAIGQRSQLARSLDPTEPTRPTSVRGVVTQAWWAPIAAAHGVLTLVFAVLVGLRTDNATLAGALVGTAVTLAFGAAVLGGLVLRLSRPVAGSGLILLGTVWWGMAFWMVWPPLITAVIWIGVIASAISSQRQATRTA